MPGTEVRPAPSWGPLEAKYTADRPRRMLALDGGGIRGVMTLEILLEIERQLAEMTGEGDGFRMGRFFDYVAGTSTGAIIAASLARGKRVQELLDFYVALGPKIFAKAPLWRRFRHLYDSAPLEHELRSFLGDEGGGPEVDLFPQHLDCLLLVVTRNVSSDSPWPVSSNPFAKYNLPHRDDCNLKIPLWKLVRASTAAPVYFKPEVITLGNSKPKEFQDGGTTPYNNPAFLLYRMATLPEFKLGWPQGESRLCLLSVGTGEGEDVQTAVARDGRSVFANATSLPGTLMQGSLVDQDLNCRTVGRCVWGWPIDREIGDLVARRPGPDGEPVPVPYDEDLGRAFLYARYNASLTRDGLEKDLGLTGIDPADVNRLDAVDRITELRAIGCKVASKVDLTPFRRFCTVG